MIQVAHNLYVGSGADANEAPGWFMVHAAREPWHRAAVGYTGRAAPKGPEYLFAHRPGMLALNLLDAADPAYIQHALVQEAVNTIGTQLGRSMKVLVHCNQGHSRGPGVALLYLASVGDVPADHDAAVEHFTVLYPDYAPADGMAKYIAANWSKYRHHEVGP